MAGKQYMNMTWKEFQQACLEIGKPARIKRYNGFIIAKPDEA